MPLRLDGGEERYSRGDDHALLERLRAGDEAAFMALVDHNTPAMQRIARAYVRDDAAAEDVVQEAWLGVLRGLPTFAGRSSLRTWIFTIVLNRAKTRGVRDARHVPFSALARDEAQDADPSVAPECFAGPGSRWPRHWSEEPVAWTDDPQIRLATREMRARIDAAIDALPPAQRAVVLLRDVAGSSTSDVGNALDLSEPNVRVDRLFRGCPVSRGGRAARSASHRMRRLYRIRPADAHNPRGTRPSRCDDARGARA